MPDRAFRADQQRDAGSAREPRTCDMQHDGGRVDPDPLPDDGIVAVVGADIHLS